MASASLFQHREMASATSRWKWFTGSPDDADTLQRGFVKGARRGAYLALGPADGQSTTMQANHFDKRDDELRECLPIGELIILLGVRGATSFHHNVSYDLLLEIIILRIA